MPLPSANYLLHINSVGKTRTRQGKQRTPLLSLGGYMKGAIFAVSALAVGCCTLPTFAQQQDLQEVMNAANALGARESELLGKKDAAGIAALFTSDGLLVMLAPQFAFKPGREAIQKHYQGIIDAGATSIVLELKNMELRGNDGVWAAGNYSVIIKDQTIHGNWFRILKPEARTWKIAMEAFARSGALDTPASASPAPNSGK
jgi:ketosteroid isomerase-like protein